MVRYINSDFAGSKTDRKSTGDYVFMLVGVANSYLSELQLIFALLTCKAECIAICEIEKEVV